MPQNNQTIEKPRLSAIAREQRLAGSRWKCCDIRISGSAPNPRQEAGPPAPPLFSSPKAMKAAAF